MESSGSLFHFTRTCGQLCSILKTHFWPQYVREDLQAFGVSTCPGIPMVSFCDIPLYRTERHLKLYGGYGIGLTKEWGMKHKINPVHYIYPESMCARVLQQVYQDALKNEAVCKCDCLKFTPQTAILFYAKPYDRPDGNDGGPYYDEREWRYIPFADDLQENVNAAVSVEAMLSDAEIDDKGVFEERNTALKEQFPLRFEVDDIRHIIVKRDVDRLKITESIKAISCSQPERDSLMTRVTSIDSLVEDFF